MDITKTINLKFKHNTVHEGIIKKAFLMVSFEPSKEYIETILRAYSLIADIDINDKEINIIINGELEKTVNKDIKLPNIEKIES